MTISKKNLCFKLGTERDNPCLVSGEGQLMAAVDNPSGAHTDTLVTDNEDGTYSVSYTPFEEGIHTLSVKFGGDHIPGSPFKVRLRFHISRV